MSEELRSKKQKTEDGALQVGGAAKAVLYSYWRSSCSWRVRIALNLKDVPFETRPIHLLNTPGTTDGGQQLQDAYAKVNSSKEVPSIDIDGVTLTQSGAIIEYLEETIPKNPLLPKDAKARALVRQICMIIGCGIQPVQNLRVLRKVMGMVDAEKKTETKMGWGKDIIDLGFQSLETVLSKSAGKYCVGDEVTMADLFLVPQVYNANRFKVDMEKYPTISKIDAELAKIPEFLAATPEKQPDAQ